MVSTRLSPGVNKIEMNMAFWLKHFFLTLENSTELFICFACVLVRVCL